MPQTGKEDAEKVMTRLMRLLDTSTVQHEYLSFPVPSRSWGVAAFPDDGKSATELFAVADVRLYQYKGQKRSVTNN
jgi:GGDEF domain-containing protein